MAAAKKKKPYTDAGMAKGWVPPQPTGNGGTDKIAPVKKGKPVTAKKPIPGAVVKKPGIGTPLEKGKAPTAKEKLRKYGSISKSRKAK